MEAVLSLSKQPNGSESKYIELLSQFNKDNIDNHEYNLKYGVAVKEEFIGAVLSFLENAESTKAKSTALTTIRLCCRQDGGLEELTRSEVHTLSSLEKGKNYA